METTLVFWLVALLLVGTGLIGLFLPVLPGAPLIFAGLVIAAWAEDFHYAGLWTVVILAILTLLTLAVDFWATIFGAKKFGASKRAVIGALIFSWVHYIGPLGYEFTVSSFAFRALMGLALNGLFLTRGFGIAAMTHAIYDVIVTIMN